MNKAVEERKAPPHVFGHDDMELHIKEGRVKGWKAPKDVEADDIEKGDVFCVDLVKKPKQNDVVLCRVDGGEKTIKRYSEGVVNGRFVATLSRWRSGNAPNIEVHPSKVKVYGVVLKMTRTLIEETEYRTRRRK